MGSAECFSVQRDAADSHIISFRHVVTSFEQSVDVGGRVEAGAGRIAFAIDAVGIRSTMRTLKDEP